MSVDVREILFRDIACASLVHVYELRCVVFLTGVRDSRFPLPLVAALLRVRTGIAARSVELALES
jgi:hypothetical protein